MPKQPANKAMDPIVSGYNQVLAVLQNSQSALKRRNLPSQSDPEKLSAAIDSIITTLTKHVEELSLLPQHQIPDSKEFPVISQDLEELFKKTCEQFKIEEKDQTLTFMSFTIQWYSGFFSRKSYKSTGNLQVTLGSINEAKGRFELYYSSIMRLYQDHNSDSLLVKYIIAQRALGLAFDKTPFYITHQCMQKELHSHFYNLIKTQTPQRQQFLLGQGPIELPPSPGAEGVDEGHIFSTLKEPPHLHIPVLNHYSFDPPPTDSLRMRYCFRLIQKKSKAWVKGLSSKQLESIVTEFVPTDTGHLRAVLTSDSADQLPWRDITSMIEQKLMDVEKKAKDIWDVKNSYRRVAVLGATGHGKSSFINSVIGEDVLHSQGGATTSWPVIVRHVPKQSTPTLEINPDHFRPFVDEIYKLQPSKVIRDLEGKASTKPGTLSRPENTQLTKWKSYQDDNAEFVEQVAQYESGKYVFPQKVEGLTEIAKMNLRIGHLIRLCYLFEKRNLQKDDNWPLLTITMKHIGEYHDLGRFEFVDLPGRGEILIPEADVNAQWEQVLTMCHGAILVFKADKIYTCDSGYIKLVENIKKLVQNIPAIAIGTCLDQGTGDSPWTEKDTREISERLWAKTNSDRDLHKSRCAVVSNIWWRSGKVLIERVKSGISDYDKLRKGEGKEVMERIIAPDLAEVIKLSPEKLEVPIQRFIDNSYMLEGFKRISQLKSCAARMALIPELVSIQGSIRELGDKYREQLDYSGRTSQQMEAIRSGYDDLKIKTEKFGLAWFHGRTAFAKAQREQMGTIAADIKKNVQADFWQVIKEHQPLFSRLSEDGTLHFEDHKEAEEYIRSVENVLRDTLDQAQRTWESTARAHISNAWDKRVKALNDIFEFDQSSQIDGKQHFRERFREQVRVELEKYTLSKTPIENLLVQLVADKAKVTKHQARQSTSNAWIRSRKKMEDLLKANGKGMPEETAGRSRFSKYFLEYPFSDSDATETGPKTRTIDPADSPPTADDLSESAHDTLGILSRSGVTVSAVGHSRLELYPWPFLEDADWDAPVELKVEKIREVYTQQFIEPWFSIKEREALQSSDGAIDVCATLGMKVLGGITNSRRTLLEAKRIGDDKTLNDASITSLILSLANCVSIDEAIGTLRTECYQDQLEFYTDMQVATAS
ncbi:hypothetical protein CPB86DRAFT_820138 [Serendipita vermifera]|nr:hypothetical protein CPB86DRAFT_820138 [Serendipita vermifera]